MSAAPKLPVAYEEADNDPKKPVVTLIGSEIPHAYLDDAEPSPLMEGASRLWGRIKKAFKLAIVLVLVGGYPVATVLAHKVDDSPVLTSSLAPWASTEAGTALTLIGRELTGAGWSADRPVWHPQARLTALPAWQNGIISALSDYAGLGAGLASDAEGEIDRDLSAASRLLAPTDETEATPRLNAAAEALQRYDGRLARGLAAAPMGQESLQARLTLFASWAAQSQTQLQRSANSAEAWPASRSDIETIYSARAHAHVVGQMMTAVLSTEPELIATPDASEALDKMIVAWDRVAKFNPIFISSQAGTGRILSDHPATMAFYVAEAEAATHNLQAKLRTQTAPPIAIADGSDTPS